MKMPPSHKRGAKSSLRRIADKLDLPFASTKGRPVKPATSGPVPDYEARLADLLKGTPDE
jgi:hypothetical protein